MLIKTKLRPKEQNEFNRYFGDLKHSITPIEGTSRQIQERIEDEKVSSQIILSSEKLFIQDIKGEAVGRIHKNLLTNIYMDMNSVQRFMLRAFVELEKNTLPIVSNSQAGDFIQGLEDDEKVMIYNQLLDFFKYFKDRESTGDTEVCVLAADSTSICGAITQSTDLRFIKLPKQIQEKVYLLELVEGQINILKYYYLMVLDIILHPFFENTIYAIEQDRPLYWCIVSLLKKLDEHISDFWRERARVILEKYFDYIEGAEVLYNELFEGDKGHGKELLKENYYFNIATGVLMNSDIQIRFFYEMNKEEKNIVINQAVSFARRINTLLVKDLERISPEVFYHPREHETELEEIFTYLKMFRFTHRTLEEVMLKKGMSKKEWIYVKNLLRTVYEEEHMQRIEEQCLHHVNNYYTIISNIALNYSLQSASSVNANLLELCKYELAYKLAIQEKTEEEKAALKDIELLYKLMDVPFKAYLDKDLMIEAQRKKGISEWMINLFVFICEDE